MDKVHQYLLLASVTIVAAPAYAYVGPGLGAGAIAVILGAIGSILLAIVAILYYPIKRFLKKRREAKAAMEDRGHEAQED